MAQTLTSKMDELLKNVDEAVEEHQKNCLHTEGQLTRLISELEGFKRDLLESEPSPEKLSQDAADVQREVRDGQKTGATALATLGRQLDTTFGPAMSDGFALRGAPGPPDRDLINVMVAQHLLRTGETQLEDEFCRETGVAVEREPFAALREIVEAMTREDVSPALEWWTAHREQVGAAAAAAGDVEFLLHRVYYVKLVNSGDWRAALAYARAHVGGAARDRPRDLRRLMGALAWAGRLTEARSPYRDLCEPWVVDDAVAAFTRVYCGTMGISDSSHLTTAIRAGMAALPGLLQTEALLASATGSLLAEHALPKLEVNLPAACRFHSVFVCPVSKETGAPMMLPCGHCVARTTLARLARGHGSRFKCPYCPSEQPPSEAVALIL